ncbi:hypothetical protein B296_00027303 [Ensete ventricosum]|uniref:Uncharacterized protein n=1 Tax=Ensete ventricosum TaxID=4639 RepID=A0A426ZA56_ENSVE|nr:hypothetical protein B296_00027303 [Ensete ventricosum]
MVPSKIDRRRSIEGDRRSEKKGRRRRRRRRRRRGEETESLPSPPTGRPRVVATRTRERFFSRARRRNISPRGEKDCGDIPR